MTSNHPAAILVITACALSAGLSAQGPFSGLVPKATFPSDHAPDLANKKLVNGAGSNSWFPFSYGTARQMALYQSHDLKIPTGNKISHLGFQAEAGRNSKGHSVQMKVYMGTSAEDAKTMKTTYDANYTGSPTQVFGGAAGKILALPDLGNSLTPNKDTPFVWLPLDTPYSFDNTKNLVVDYQCLANNNSNKAWSYYLDVARLVSPVKKNGDGCKDGSGRIPLLKSRPASIGATWYLDLSNAPGSATAIMMASVGKAAAPIPFGGPGCNLHINPAPGMLFPVWFLAMTNTSGRYTWNFPVPDDPILNDLHIYTQTTVADVFAPGGYAFSNGDDMQIGMHPRMSVLYRQGTPASLTTGSAYRNYGVISHFIH